MQGRQGESGLAALPGREREWEASFAQALDYITPSAAARSIACRQGAAGAAAGGGDDVHPKSHARRRGGGEANITLLIEPINPRDRPDYFLNRAEHAADIIAKVGAPNVRIQFDFYHVQIVGGDLIRRFEKHLPVVGHVQIAAVPSRAEPDEGEINYPALFEAIDRPATRAGSAANTARARAPRKGSAGRALRRRAANGVESHASRRQDRARHRRRLRHRQVHRRDLCARGRVGRRGRHQLAAAKSAARAIGNNAMAVRCDVPSKAEIAARWRRRSRRSARSTSWSTMPAATHVNKPMLEIDEAEFDRIYAVNVKGIFLFCQAVVPHFRKQRSGAIINIGSTAGLRPRPGLSAYNATKGAVHMLTKSLAVELAPDRIRVCAIAPVATDTPLLPSFLGPAEGRREKFIATVPLGRLALPQDIANAALFLASADAEFVTGNIVEVDGGRSV